MDDGVYFGLPFADYLAEPRLSSSGIKNLAVSPLCFWYNSPLNPDYDPQETDAQKMGTAHHTAILEGLDEYERQYAVKPIKPEGNVTLDTLDELKACCEKIGLKRSGSKRELIARIKEFDPEIPIWQDVMDLFAIDAKDKIIISAEHDRKIRLQHMLVHGHPAISEAFKGGFPEVTVFWEDEATGVPLKSRIDYLTPTHAVDLKSFTNPLSKPIAELIPQIIVNRGYHVQAALYTRAMAATATFGPDEWHGPSEAVKALQGASGQDERPFVFVFVGTDVPHVRARSIQTSEMIWQIANDQVNNGIAMYAECVERYGDDIWFDSEPVLTLTDVEFPMYAFN